MASSQPNAEPVKKSANKKGKNKAKNQFSPAFSEKQIKEPPSPEVSEDQAEDTTEASEPGEENEPGEEEEYEFEINAEDMMPQGEYEARLTGYLPYEYIKYSDNQMAHELHIVVGFTVRQLHLELAMYFTSCSLSQLSKTLIAVAHAIHQFSVIPTCVHCYLFIMAPM